MGARIAKNSRSLRWARLFALRDIWIAAETARTAAFKALRDAHRHSPEAKALAAAENAEKRAKDAYAKALQQEQEEYDHGTDTWNEATDRG